MVLALAGTGTANAQMIFYGPGYYYHGPRYYAPGLPPSQILRIVQHAGFAPLSAPMRRGPNYVVPAVGRGGGNVTVVVSAYAGEIVSVRPVMALQPYGAPAPYDPRVATVPPAYGAAPPTQGPGPGPGAGYEGVGPGAGSDRGTHPLPPRPIPNERLANVPTTGSVTAAPAPPMRTPIPRPRPSVASNDAQTTTAASPRTGPGAAASPANVPEAPPAPARPKPATPMVPVAPLD